MYLRPFPTQKRQTLDRFSANASCLPHVEAIYISKFERAIRAVEVKYGFTLRTGDMNVSGPVVVGVDYDAETVKAINGWRIHPFPLFSGFGWSISIFM